MYLLGRLATFLYTLLSMVYLGSTCCGHCARVETIDRKLTDAYCNQPLFYNFLPKTEETQLLDNVCFTFYPLPDDPDTFTVYQARVFCDGSSDIVTSIATQLTIGSNRISNPFGTVTDSVLAYTGCDTYLVYRCANFGECFEPFVYGLSASCSPIGLSCLRKVEETIRSRGLNDGDYYVLPMKLPNRCVSQQLCLQPPNPFYNKLPGITVV